ncbi:oxidoreductase FAD/NAD(P)-binding domain protein [Thermodesulfobium narugense DSM 14796]|uniref:Dihydroorotate dehydrogenase B (NAD(+)), electron transfer subunit n=1 Tax=Thermodesulfobium narugense DSM 14796 TaxID=747365 RepID=M1E613_9BACT|nr:dihydroorotate dehydrogenase electron transfer subunit [Thermodesulfobium narugense]AEE13943.1 oxidoreductase FAD/NAD(P)-binding domain protein [Thermodesulfobium narugense DSM 14796]
MIEAKVIKTEKISNFHFLMDLKVEENLSPLPGQYFMLKLNDLNDPFFMRPFSVFDSNSDRLSFLIEIKGKGTKILSKMNEGHFLKIRGPLGNGFKFDKIKSALLYAGGTGIAPIFYLAKHLKKVGIEIDVVLGFRNKDRVICVDKFSNFGNLFVFTDDGSYANKGTVIDFKLEKTYDSIFACGPVLMLKAIQRKHRGAQISLESVFACGAGACMGCVVKSIRGYLRVCKDGPVFNAEEIIF